MRRPHGALKKGLARLRTPKVSQRGCLVNARLYKAFLTRIPNEAENPTTGFASFRRPQPGRWTTARNPAADRNNAQLNSRPPSRHRRQQRARKGARARASLLPARNAAHNAEINASLAEREDAE